LSDALILASKDLAHVYWGDQGAFAYQCFEYVNEHFYEGRLPWTMIQWAPTPWGKCLGQTRLSANPVITLHPSIMTPRSPHPWLVAPGYLGAAFVYEVVLHECMHVWVEYVLGGSTGESSHNCPEWIGEVNRIMPMLGFHGVRAGMTKPKRVPVLGEQTKTGKPLTKVTRVTDGDLPLEAISSFPHGVRQLLGLMDYYRRKELPFAPDLPETTLLEWGVTCSCALHNVPELEAADD